MNATIEPPGSVSHGVSELVKTIPLKTVKSGSRLLKRCNCYFRNSRCQQYFDVLVHVVFQAVVRSGTFDHIVKKIRKHI